MSPQVSWKKPLFLSLFLFAFGTLAYWLEFSHKPKEVAQTELSKKLFDIKDQVIQSVTIETPKGGFRFDCTKSCKAGGTGNAWTVKSLEDSTDSKTVADDSNINSLLSSLQNLSASETFDLSVHSPEKRTGLLKEYGLTSEQRAVKGATKVRMKIAGKEWVAFFGVTHPIGDGIFTITQTGDKPDENRVLLTPGYFKSNFERDFTYWRNKRIFSFVPADVAQFKMDGKKGNFLAEKRDTNWFIKTSQDKSEISADFESIDNFLSNLSSISAKGFISEVANAPEAKKAMAGTGRVAHFEFKTKDSTGEVTVFETTGKTPRLFAVRGAQDPVVELELSSRDRFVKDPKDFRLMKLMALTDRFSIRRISLKSATWAAPAVLTSKGGTWTLEGQTKPVNADRVQQMLEKMSGNRIQTFVPGMMKPGPKDPFFHLELGDEKDPAKLVFSVWQKGTELFVQNEKATRKEYFRVDPAIASGLPIAPNAVTPDYFLTSNPPPKADAVPPLPGPGAGLPSLLPAPPTH